MSNPRSPSTVTAAVSTEPQITSRGAKPQPGLSKAFPGRGEIPKKVSPSMASSKSLWTTQSPVLMVDGIFDGQRVFIRKKGNVGLRLGQVVEHPSVSNTLPMGSDCTGGKI